MLPGLGALGRRRADQRDRTGQLAVYVKHRGALGRGYMAMIGPFRHAIVYPALLGAIARRWGEVGG